MKDRRANMSDLKKGFVFFIEQEKREIKRSVAMHKARQLQLKDNPEELARMTPSTASK